MADAARILDEALALDETERAKIAHELLVSLDGVDADAEAAWAGEIRRRIDAVETGGAPLEEWNAVQARLRASLRR